MTREIECCNSRPCYLAASDIPIPGTCLTWAMYVPPALSVNSTDRGSRALGTELSRVCRSQTFIARNVSLVTLGQTRTSPHQTRGSDDACLHPKEAFHSSILKRWRIMPATSQVSEWSTRLALHFGVQPCRSLLRTPPELSSATYTAVSCCS